MQYRMPPMQSQAAFHNMIPQVNQGSAMRAIAPDLARAVAPRNYAVPSASYMGSAYPALPGLQYPMAYHGGIMSHQPLSGSPGSRPPAMMTSNSPTNSGAGASSGGQVEGWCPLPTPSPTSLSHSLVFIIIIFFHFVSRGEGVVCCGNVWLHFLALKSSWWWYLVNCFFFLPKI